MPLAQSQRRILFSISAVIFLLYAAQGLLRPVLPRYIEFRTETDAAAVVGLIVMLNWGAQALLSVPSGSLSDRIGRRRIIIIGGLTAAGGFILLPAASSVILIMVVYTIAGFGQGSYSTATAAYPIDLARSGQTARAIGWTQASRQTALFAFGPALGGLLASFLGFNFVFILAAILAIAAVVLSIALLPKINPTLTREKEKPKTSFGIRSTLGNRIIIGALVATFSLQYANNVFASFLPLYAAGLSLAVIGALFGFQGVMNMVGRPLVGELSNRIKHRTAVIGIGMLLGSGGMFLLSLSLSFELLAASAVLVGLSTGIAIVLILLTIAEQAPRERRGFVIGFFNTSLYLGLGLGPAIQGLVIANFGFKVGFQSAAFVPLVGLVIFAILSRKRRDQME